MKPNKNKIIGLLNELAEMVTLTRQSDVLDVLYDEISKMPDPLPTEDEAREMAFKMAMEYDNVRVIKDSESTLFSVWDTGKRQNQAVCEFKFREDEDNDDES